MKILIGSWFRLPRLGGDVFSALVREHGVQYDRELGFRLDAGSDIEAAVRTISAGLGEEVELSVRCYICGKQSCPGCPYLDVCDRRRVSPSCLCGEHGPEKGVYPLYQRTFTDNFS